MSADTLATGSINSFAGPAGQVQASEEQIFVLSSNQLRGLIQEAVKVAMEPLEARLEALEEATARERAYDRQRIKKLEAPKTTAKTQERAEKIKRYLENRPDHRTTLETVKGYLGIKNYLLDDAIRALQADYPDSFVVERAKTGDKRKKIIRMLSRY
jgi:hypothetical protein